MAGEKRKFQGPGLREWLPPRGMRLPQGNNPGEDPLRPGPGYSSGGTFPLEWLIIGGGVQGTYLAHLLVHRLGIAPQRLGVLDPHSQPLYYWKSFTERVGMRYLRSPVVHHLDLAPRSLQAYLSPEERESGRLLKPYQRPALELFNRHADWIIHHYRLARLRIQGRATDLEAIPGGYRVTWTGGALLAERVLLAIGMAEQPHWPPWALKLKAQGAGLWHVFQRDFPYQGLPGAFPGRARAVVLGGGLSGVQLALALAAEQPGRVILISRHPLRVHFFDAEPGWQGPNRMQAFAREPDPDRRRALIRQARYRGSITPEVSRQLKQAIKAGRLSFFQAGVLEARVGPPASSAGGGRSISIRTSRGAVSCDLLFLATGFQEGRPGGAWLERAVERLRLPCGIGGFPLVDRSLCWRRGLYVTGPLAELELGPVARNISGAHRAAARLLHFLAGAAGSRTQGRRYWCNGRDQRQLELPRWEFIVDDRQGSRG